MKHANFNHFPKDYKTFAELADYARRRAKHSAARNGHQEFAYWHEIAYWAAEMANTSGADCELNTQLETCLRALNVYKAVAKPGTPRTLATYYAHAVHIRQMLINRGEKPPRLSLSWLREAAQRL